MRTIKAFLVITEVMLLLIASCLAVNAEERISVDSRFGESERRINNAALQFARERLSDLPAILSDRRVKVVVARSEVSHIIESQDGEGNTSTIMEVALTDAYCDYTNGNQMVLKSRIWADLYRREKWPDILLVYLHEMVHVCQLYQGSEEVYGRLYPGEVDKTTYEIEAYEKEASFARELIKRPELLNLCDDKGTIRSAASDAEQKVWLENVEFRLRNALKFIKRLKAKQAQAES